MIKPFYKKPENNQLPKNFRKNVWEKKSGVSGTVSICVPWVTDKVKLKSAKSIINIETEEWLQAAWS